jgi:transposase
MAKRKTSTFERLQMQNGKLSRSERRELQRRLYSDDPGLTIMFPDTAGIDIGNESHYVAVPKDRNAIPVREFGAWTAALEEMAQWLKACRIKTVVMQSTGVYWMAVYDVLSRHGFDVHLVDARGTKNLPGRKSDVAECQWLQKLQTFGLLRRCFLPSEQIRQLRTIWRMRGDLIKAAASEVQHMQRALIQMNIQLPNAISDVSGVTGQAIIRAILQGERDPEKLADLRHPYIKASREEILFSLLGDWKEDILFELQQAVDRYDFLQGQVVKCDKRLQEYMATLPSRNPSEAAPAPSAQPQKVDRRRAANRTRKPKGNQPAFDLESELQRILGVNAKAINGLDVMTIQTVLAEVGPDLSAWKTERHWASWLNLAPKRDVSGGKVIRHVREHRTNRVGNAFRLAAQALFRSETYLGAKFRHLRAKLGAGKAIKAMARTLACLYYRLITKGQVWVDRGSEEFERKRKQRELAALQRKASHLGMQLVPAA